MSRQAFIKLVKADARSQWLQAVLLMSLIASFGGLGVSLVSRWEAEVVKPASPHLWIILGLTVLFAVLAVFMLRRTSRYLLKCPHCQKCLGGLLAQVVVASGRCGHCGGRIIEADEL